MKQRCVWLAGVTLCACVRKTVGCAWPVLSWACVTSVGVEQCEQLRMLAGSSFCTLFCTLFCSHPQVLKDLCLALGAQEGQVFIEVESLNCGGNARCSMELAQRLGLKPQRIIMVQVCFWFVVLCFVWLGEEVVL